MCWSLWTRGVCILVSGQLSDAMFISKVALADYWTDAMCWSITAFRACGVFYCSVRHAVSRRAAISCSSVVAFDARVPTVSLWLLSSFLTHFLIMRKKALLYSLWHHICVCMSVLRNCKFARVRGKLTFAITFKRTIMRKCALRDSPPGVQINFFLLTWKMLQTKVTLLLLLLR